MTHSPAPPFAHSSGPRDAKIALVGEAWGKDEALVKLPFMGYSGQELTRMLLDANIARRDCFLTNVFALRPPDNNVDALCVKKGELPPNYASRPIRQGKYVKPEFLPEVERLRQEILTVRPNVVVALGNIASWALLSATGIGTIRGAITDSTLCPGVKVLPTYHPAGVLRNWAWRPIVIADLLKAARESAFQEIRRPRRAALVNPTLAEIAEWIKTHGETASALAIDTETTRGQIDMVGFASSPSQLMVVPFIRKDLTNYWADPADEVRARQHVQHLLTLPCPKIFQNGLYDLQYFAKEGFTLRNVADDTMLRQHSLYPEMPKGLGFLGSIHTNESSWKLLNRHRADEAVKKDD